MNVRSRTFQQQILHRGIATCNVVTLSRYYERLYLSTGWLCLCACATSGGITGRVRSRRRVAVGIRPCACLGFRTSEPQSPTGSINPPTSSKLCCAKKQRHLFDNISLCSLPAGSNPSRGQGRQRVCQKGAHYMPRAASSGYSSCTTHHRSEELWKHDMEARNPSSRITVRDVKKPQSGT